MITALPEQRRLIEKPTEGNKTVLVVRVTSKGIAEQIRAERVHDYLWKDRDGSFVNQMRACSSGKLNFQ